MNRPSTLNEATDQLGSFVQAMESLESGSYEEISSLLYDHHDVPGALATVIRSFGEKSRSYEDRDVYFWNTKVSKTKLTGLVAEHSNIAPSVQVGGCRTVVPTFVYPVRGARKRELIFERRTAFRTTLGAVHTFDGFFNETNGWQMPQRHSATSLQATFDMLDRATVPADDSDEAMVSRGRALVQLVPNGGEMGHVIPDFGTAVTDLSRLVLKATA